MRAGAPPARASAARLIPSEGSGCRSRKEAAAGKDGVCVCVCEREREMEREREREGGREGVSESGSLGEREGGREREIREMIISRPTIIWTVNTQTIESMLVLLTCASLSPSVQAAFAIFVQEGSSKMCAIYTPERGMFINVAIKTQPQPSLAIPWLYVLFRVT